MCFSDCGKSHSNFSKWLWENWFWSKATTLSTNFVFLRPWILVKSSYGQGLYPIYLGKLSVASLSRSSSYKYKIIGYTFFGQTIGCWFFISFSFLCQLLTANSLFEVVVLVQGSLYWKESVTQSKIWNQFKCEFGCVMPGYILYGVIPKGKVGSEEIRKVPVVRLGILHEVGQLKAKK